MERSVGRLIPGRGDGKVPMFSGGTQKERV